MDLSLILGPILLAVVANCVLYGICVVQWFNYYTAGFKDSWPTKLLVIWVVCLDTFQTAATIYMLWEFTVPNFGNPAIFENLPWPFPTTPICSKASVPIQLFLGYRIKVLSHTWIWFIVIAALSLAQGGCGIAGGILATLVSNPADFKKLIPVADAWISLAVFTDVLITCLLFFFLHRSKTGFQRMDSIIERLIRIAVETASIGAAFCVIDVIVFNVRSDTNLHYFFALLQGRIYTNTLMVTLNSRAGLRERMNTNEAQGFGPEGISGTFRIKPAEVSVAVQQDIQMDALDSRSDTSVEKKSFYPV